MIVRFKAKSDFLSAAYCFVVMWLSTIQGKHILHAVFVNILHALWIFWSLSLFLCSWKEKVHVWPRWRSSYRRKPRPTVRLHWPTLSWRISCWYNTQPPVLCLHIVISFLVSSLAQPLADTQSAEFWSSAITWVTFYVFWMSCRFSRNHKFTIYTDCIGPVLSVFWSQEKNSTIQHYQSLMSKKQRDYQQSLEKCKKSQSQQFTEQQHRIEMVEYIFVFVSSAFSPLNPSSTFSHASPLKSLSFLSTELCLISHKRFFSITLKFTYK